MNTERKIVTTNNPEGNLSIIKSARTGKCNESTMPVIKVNFQGDILYANLASLPLMGEWGCSANQKLPGWFLSEFSDIFNHMSCHELKIPFSSYAIYFTVVPFVEAGYIGLYAFHVEDINKINPIG
ncbi:MAG: hypothetical protein ACR2GN_00465 [Bacteroidia bacterium]